MIPIDTIYLVLEYIPAKDYVALVQVDRGFKEVIERSFHKKLKHGINLHKYNLLTPISYPCDCEEIVPEIKLVCETKKDLMKYYEMLIPLKPSDVLVYIDDYVSTYMIVDVGDRLLEFWYTYVNEDIDEDDYTWHVERIGEYEPKCKRVKFGINEKLGNRITANNIDNKNFPVIDFSNLGNHIMCMEDFLNREFSFNFDREGKYVNKTIKIKLNGSNEYILQKL